MKVWLRIGREHRGAVRRVHRLAVLAAAVVFTLPLAARAQGGGGGDWSGYQRKGMNAGYGNGPWLGDWKRRPIQQYSSQVTAGTFQRPYPYHLDYYRMKYGGSYAPYFGNLYGPPNYNYYGQPYYGDYSPYYGYNGYGYGYSGYGYGNNGYPPGILGRRTAAAHGCRAGRFSQPARNGWLRTPLAPPV